MNIILYLFEHFFRLQWKNMLGLLFISLILSFIYTNVSSKINAKIIQSVQTDHMPEAFKYFWYFAGASAIYMVILYSYKMFQNHLLTHLTNWVKKVLFEFILKSNNEDMKNINFAEFITPITRISSAATALLNDLIGNLIPTLGFLFVIVVYFLLLDWKLGIGFLIGNILLFCYLLFYWNTMFNYKREQEKLVVENERYILDNLNNIDKIIYRGMAENEIETFNKKTDKCIDTAITMTQYVTNHMIVMNTMAFAIIFASIYYILKLQSSKQIDKLTVITFMTILIIYRNNISETLQSIPHNIDLVSRIDFIIREFNEMIEGQDINIIMDKDGKYTPTDIPFDRIEFQNVSFQYFATDKPVFENYSKDLYLNNKIIGITGQSGNGKSSFVKLILRLHDCTKGKVLIDGKDIKSINPNYIRENITYVNQNSRLFDREILTNIFYGCKDSSKCSDNLKDIMSFEKIRDLYRNVDLNTDAGPLGENLSGGQRQVANLISGLINPTPILILDEPTNALDPHLKREVLAIINQYRDYKKCIMIITHDKEVYSLFDEVVDM